MTARITDRLAGVDERLSARDRDLIQTVGRLRLVSAEQLERLWFSEISESATRQRRVRRVLGRLVEHGLVHRLERRIGGVRAGSSGNVYRLAPDGERLLAYWRGDGLGRARGLYEPGEAYVAHTLAVGDLYVRLVEAERAGRVEVIEHQAEPQCWRSFTGLGGRALILRPDSYVRLGVGAGEFELRAFIEVDRATVGSVALTRKHRAYLDYVRSGREQAAHGGVPAVVWVTTDQRRVELLDRVAAGLGTDAKRLFFATTSERAMGVLGADSGVDEDHTGKQATESAA